MKLSKLLELNPMLDCEMRDVEGYLFLDGFYMFRVIDPTAPPSSSIVNLAGTPHTDGIIRRGLLTTATQAMAAGWDVDSDE